jgi:transposase
MGRPSRYPQELRVRAVRLVAEVRSDHDSEWAAMEHVARLLGVGSTETIRHWVRRAEVDGGRRPGVTSDAAGELVRLKRENAELRRANEILKAAAAFFGAELDRPGRR